MPVAINALPVSIHAPAGGATEKRCVLGRIPEFQSTRPQGARRGTAQLSGEGGRFNPRARRGRDCACEYNKHSGFVSIHAPAGGATSHRSNLLRQRIVSIHAPAGGATAVIGSPLTICLFQSTRPQGARPIGCWRG